MFFYKKSFAVFLLLSLFIFTFSVSPVLAQYGLEETARAAEIPTGNSSLPTLIGSFINIVLGVIGVVFLVLLLYAGFLWMTAMGDSKKISTAKDLIIAAVSGIIVIVLAYSITSFVLNSLSDVGNTSSESSGLKDLPEGL